MMLVLTRKPGEKIIIAGNIVVEVLEVVGAKVRLGITAPEDVSIYRQEMLEAMKRHEKEQKHD